MIDTLIELGDLRLNTEGFKNPRFESGLNEEAIRELAGDIEARGLLYPLLVWRNEAGEHIIIGGQRRYLALSLLYAKEFPVPAKLLDAQTIEEAYCVSLADNNQRENLSPYEIAAALSTMTGTIDEIVEMSGVSRSRASKLITIWNYANQHTLGLLRQGSISETQAYKRAREIRDAPPVAGKAKPKPKPIPGPRSGPKPKGGEGPLHRRPSHIHMLKVLKNLPNPSKSYEKGIVHAMAYFVRGVEPDDPNWQSYLAKGRMPDHGDTRTDSGIPTSNDTPSDSGGTAPASGGVAGSPASQGV